MEPSDGAATSWRKGNEERGSDCCAWYLSYHFGDPWGIFIDERCLYGHASDIHYQLGLTMEDSVRAAYLFLLKHEMFHHYTDLFISMMEISENAARYVPYTEEVYNRVWCSSDCVEEALANRKVWWDKEIQDYLTKDYLEKTLGAQPPGYSDFKKCSMGESRYKYKTKLKNQIITRQKDPLGPLPVYNYSMKSRYSEEDVLIWLCEDSSRTYPEPIIQFISSLPRENLEESKKFRKELNKLPKEIQDRYEKKMERFEWGVRGKLKKIRSHEDVFRLHIDGAYLVSLRRIEDNEWLLLRIGKHDDILKNPE